MSTMKTPEQCVKYVQSEQERHQKHLKKFLSVALLAISTMSSETDKLTPSQAKF